MDRLVSVDIKELQIPFRPSNPCTTTFQVTNLMHTMSVAVYLTTTRPGLFYLNPSTPSLLPPLSSLTFTLSISSSTRPPSFSSSDVLTIKSAIFPTAKPTSAALNMLFNRHGVRVFKDASIPILFVGPHVVDALLLSSETVGLEYFLSKAVEGCGVCDLNSLLRRAAAAGNSSFVSAIVAAGADVNSRGSDGRSALSLAVLSGNLEAVDVLVKTGARIDDVDRIFHDAAAANRVDLIEILAKSKKIQWVDVVDSDGRTPIHYAAANGCLEAVRLCLESGGGDPDLADKIGWTPLHCAAAGGFLDVVEFLIEKSLYNPKIVITFDSKKTPFDLAMEGGHSHLYDVLKAGDDLFRLVSSGNLAGVKSCLSKGVEIDRRDQNGWTALHRAAFGGKIEIVKVLIEGGAELDVVDDVGFTPLRCAVEMGHAEVAVVLVGSGARAGLKGMIKGRNICLPMGMNFDSYCGVKAAVKDNSFPFGGFCNKVI